MILWLCIDVNYYGNGSSELTYYIRLRNVDVVYSNISVRE